MQELFEIYLQISTITPLLAQKLQLEKGNGIAKIDLAAPASS